MGRIAGHYEWDDDDLTPGNKREGGLHQNLFDGDGNLKGSARFVPGAVDASDPFVVTETVYVPIEERRRTRQEDELQQLIAVLVSHWIDRGVARAKPMVAQWWRDSARPAFDDRRAAVQELRSRRKARRSVDHVDTSPIDVPSSEMTPSPESDRQRMSAAEAQARYMAALAARAFSDEQLRLVSSATIVDAHGIADLEQLMRELPPEQVKRLIEAMAINPSMLSEQTLAELASVLGRRAL